MRKLCLRTVCQARKENRRVPSPLFFAAAGPAKALWFAFLGSRTSGSTRRVNPRTSTCQLRRSLSGTFSRLRATSIATAESIELAHTSLSSELVLARAAPSFFFRLEAGSIIDSGSLSNESSGSVAILPSSCCSPTTKGRKTAAGVQALFPVRVTMHSHAATPFVCVCASERRLPCS